MIPTSIVDNAIELTIGGHCHTWIDWDWDSEVVVVRQNTACSGTFIFQYNPGERQKPKWNVSSYMWCVSFIHSFIMVAFLLIPAIDMMWWMNECVLLFTILLHLFLVWSVCSRHNVVNKLVIITEIEIYIYIYTYI